MLAFLLSLINPLATVTNGILELLKLRTQVSADVTKDKIDAEIKKLDDQRDVLVAAQASSYSRDVYWSLLAFAAIGPVAYICKYFLWDKVIGAFYGCVGRHGNTLNCALFTSDGITNNDWWIVTTVFTFLFLASRR